MKDDEKVRQTVRESYGRIVSSQGDCSCGPSTGCCDGPTALPEDQARKLGYTADELAKAPDGSNLGLGCGNPQAIAELAPGEVVLDLGSGAGFDSFLAARQVGESGRVIGVDMTPEMLAKARENARKGGYANVEFRLGEIENLPVADGSVDVIISNCVINLSPDKQSVFRDSFRVLKPGGLFVMTTPASWTDGLLRLMAKAGLVSREEIEEHKDTYSPGKIVEILRKGNFRSGMLRYGHFQMFANIWVTATK